MSAPGRFWLWMSLLLACGWAASGAYWWLRSRRAMPREAPVSETESLRTARRRLQEACAADDAAAARETLLTWGRALLAPREIGNLHQLGRLLGRDFTREVEELNRSLYAKRHGDWRGADLADLCAQLERQRSEPEAAPVGLAPLKPAG